MKGSILALFIFIILLITCSGGASSEFGKRSIPIKECYYADDVKLKEISVDGVTYYIVIDRNYRVGVICPEKDKAIINQILKQEDNGTVK